MKGDFTRDSFNRYNHHTRVLMQQGRVQLDADWNEQAAISQHYLRTLAADIIGPHGGPLGQCGFGVITDVAAVVGMTGLYGRPLGEERVSELKQKLGAGDFVIGPGRYYVDGLLCENDVPLTYTEQPGYPYDDEPTPDRLGAARFLVYLDVWERHVTGVEAPDVLEAALGGPDTATRAQLVWQVKVLGDGSEQSCASIDDLRRPAPPTMRARAKQPQEQLDACVIDPEARYRGAENQLYRVEVHRGGVARGSNSSVGGATFKWSRENGSVTVPVLTASTEAGATTVAVGSLGRDLRLGLAPKDWVELVDDNYVLRGRADPLLVVDRIDRDDFEVVLRGGTSGSTGQDTTLHPMLRRWDHDASQGDEGALLVTESESGSDSDDGWIELEGGVMIQFPPSDVAGRQNEYRTGDYWLVPARTATGDVVWPRRKVGDEVEWEARPPNGVEHHYAPLAVASLIDGALTALSPDCRCRFAPLPCVSDT